MSFYGAVVRPTQATPFVPPPEDWVLHLSQAALAADVPEGKRVSLLVKHADEEPTIICTLAGAPPQQRGVRCSGRVGPETGAGALGLGGTHHHQRDSIFSG